MAINEVCAKSAQEENDQCANITEDEKRRLRMRLAEEQDIDANPDDLLKSKGIVRTEQMRLAYNAGKSMRFDYCLSCLEDLLCWIDVCPICGENLLAQRMEG